ADLDGDGHSELIFTTLSSVAVAVIGGPLETSAVTRFSEADLHVPGTALPALADVTGDGLPEIITLTDTTAHVFQVSR
ncbi:MAG: VCBS repeat-containing protein, partial [Myxococcales bacterium]|nr:VCBS repeat-containing protein [Myxococcales bacterium]